MSNNIESTSQQIAKLNDRNTNRNLTEEELNRTTDPEKPIPYKQFNVSKFFSSFDHAVRGVIFLLKSEQNARIHAAITILVGIIAYILEVSHTDAAILFMAVILVFAIEIINTAIEKVFDVCHPGQHKLIRAAKDAMAGAVLISAIIAIVVAFLIFLPYIKRLILN